MVFFLFYFFFFQRYYLYKHYKTLYMKIQLQCYDINMVIDIIFEFISNILGLKLT